MEGIATAGGVHGFDGECGLVNQALVGDRPAAVGAVGDDELGVGEFC